MRIEAERDPGVPWNVLLNEAAAREVSQRQTTGVVWSAGSGSMVNSLFIASSSYRLIADDDHCSGFRSRQFNGSISSGSVGASQGASVRPRN